MAKKYKLRYYRDKCIGAAACVAVAPEYWDLDEEGKAILKGGKKIDENTWEVEITEEQAEQLKLARESEDVCPTQAIEVVEVKEE